jgi:ComF family protein
MGLLKSLLYPPYARCYCCGHPRLDGMGDHLCVPCREELASIRKQEIFFFAEGAEKVYAPYPYEGAAKELIHCLKYTCVRDAAKVLGREMAACLAEDSFDALVPVPLHPTRLIERGFNQAELLAQAVGEQKSISVLPALERLRETGQQAKLEKELRIKNMEDAFQTCKKVKGMRLLLVDDVCTTGATAKACIRALSSAGAKNVSLCVAAVTLKMEHLTR